MTAAGRKVNVDGMKIGAVAESSGVPPKSIRYYESIGLIHPAERRRNGYRSYSPHGVVSLPGPEDLARVGATGEHRQRK